MEDRQRRLVIVFLATLVLAGTVSAGIAQDTATGSLTLNGTTVPLRYAYAAAKPGFFDKKTEDIHILLSDVELSDEARDDDFALMKLARQGRAHVVEVVLDAASQPVSGAFYAQVFNGMVSASGMHRFEKQAIERTRVAGRLSAEAHTFAGVSYQYDATFTARIPRPPTPEETAAALASPAAGAARAYVAAIRAGTLDALRSTVTSAAAGALQGPAAAAQMADLRANTPADSRVVQVVSLTASSARATVQGSRDGIIIEMTLAIVLENGTWKVDR